jgi:hypothetical protein
MPIVSMSAAALALAAAGPAPVPATATLPASRIPADAVWVAHMDCEALRASKVGRFVLENRDRLHIDSGGIDEVRAELGFDPVQDILSLTAYGTDRDPDDGQVLIVVTTQAADTALERLSGRCDVKVEKIDAEGYSLHLISSGGERHLVHVAATDRPDRRIVTLAGDQEHLIAALRVAGGRAPSLAAGMGLLARPPRAGSMVFVSASRLDGMDDVEPASEILRLSEGLVADVAERDGALLAEVTVSAASEEAARNIGDVVRGMAALGTLAAGREPDLAPLRELARSLSVETDRQRVTLSVRFPVEALIDLLQEAQRPPGTDGTDP